MLNKSEVDYILKNSKVSSEPFITLNDTLTDEEIKELNNVIKEYSDKNNKIITQRRE